jgi:Tfp pilus assembly protein PilO
MSVKPIENRGWQFWKRVVLIAIAVVCAADVALAVFLWQGSREGPEELQAQGEKLRAQAKLLQADVNRGREIRTSLPQVGKDCDNFYHDAFLDPTTAYSEVSSDLETIARKSNLRTTDINFKQKALKDHGVTEVSITGSVEGEYPALVQFINGLERSKNMYLLDGLSLGSASTGGIRLRLDLRTYFRS